MNDTQLSVLKCAIATYGREKQLDMVIEEMSELTKAICKFKRKAVSNAHLSESRDVIEETADVIIMIEQIIIMLNSTDEVEAVIEEKIERLKQKLESSCEICRTETWYTCENCKHCLNFASTDKIIYECNHALSPKSRRQVKYNDSCPYFKEENKK